MERLNQLLFQIISAPAGRHIFWDDAAVFLADFLWYFLILGAVVFLVLERNSRKRWFIFLEAALAIILSRGLIAEILQWFYIHPRPFVFYEVEPLVRSLGNSFPSGHTTFLFSLATTLYFYSRRWGAWYFAFGILMGISRVFTGVHWPLDILGGMLIGSGSAILIHRLLRNSWTKSPELTVNSGRPE